MASPPILDIASLLGPIPGENPAGAKAHDLMRTIQEHRREEDPDEYPEGDPRRPKNPKKANWKAIIQLVTEALRSKSKDLWLVGYLTEALLKVHGFLGLRDGLHLFRELVDKCWDRLLPPLDETDLELRANPFINLLDDPAKGLRLPTSVRMVPLVFTKEGAFSYLDRFSVDRARPPRVSNEDWERALKNVYLKTCQQTLEDLDQCLAYLNQLMELLQAGLKEQAPGFTSLRPALTDCQGLLREVIQQQDEEAAGPAVSPSGNTPAESARANTGQPSAAVNLASRKEAYRQLAQAAAFLKELEPHSPIPYLVQKAVELGNLPFPELIRTLIRDAAVLADLNRELGIKEQESAEQGSSE
jgi:type VI secretion system protein ImpA